MTVVSSWLSCFSRNQHSQECPLTNFKLKRLWCKNLLLGENLLRHFGMLLLLQLLLLLLCSSRSCSRKVERGKNGSNWPFGRVSNQSVKQGDILFQSEDLWRQRLVECPRKHRVKGQVVPSRFSGRHISNRHFFKGWKCCASADDMKTWLSAREKTLVILVTATRLFQ